MARAPSPSSPFTVCVYCGSRPGVDPAHVQAARQTGQIIGQSGWQLVYGGGRVGLMGVVADAVLASGGRVVGVIPRKLREREVGHNELTEIHVVDTMHQRKQMMAERADAFLALPGGIGTLEELFEVWTWRQIGYHDQPIGVLNVTSFYDGLLAFMQSTVNSGFLDQNQLDGIHVSNNAAELLGRLHDASVKARGLDDYRDI